MGSWGRGVVEGQVDEVEEAPLPLGQAGEKAVGHHPAEGRGHRSLQGPVDGPGQGGVRGDLLEG